SIVDDRTGEKLYTLRIPSPQWRPPVFAAGTYSLQVSVPESGKRREFKAIIAAPDTKDHLEIYV
ncbi:MAG TPA: hypothetical protein PLN52_11625, partial [Opitutaceae bacterium]|nr:hypothetical protein [Opitutaceae bacterium]